MIFIYRYVIKHSQIHDDPFKSIESYLIPRIYICLMIEKQQLCHGHTNKQYEGQCVHPNINRSHYNIGNNISWYDDYLTISTA